MSFILDALRKSEHARQRQTGPGLAEVQVAATKPKSNIWATAAVALLVVNLLAVGILLLRRAQKDDPAAAPAATTATAAGPAAGAASGPANPTLGMPPPTAGTPVTQGTAPVRAPIDEPAGPGGRNPLADEVGNGSDGQQASARAAAAAVPAGPPAVVNSGAARRGGSVVYAPVPEASELPYSPPPAPAAVQRSAPPAAAMPNADEVAARGGVAALHLDLHVYATQPQQRFIFVNSRKYKEGDTLAEGPVVEQITPDGAVLSFQGSQFRLSND
jgi:general secretion pathway protein B